MPPSCPGRLLPAYAILCSRIAVQEKIASPSNFGGPRQIMASSLTNLLYHIVFSTKERFPLIHEDLEEALYDYIGGILRGQRGILLEIGGMPDHVHLLVKLKADLAVAQAVRLVKSNSSGWVNENQKIRGRFEWQTGYFAVSVSESRVDEVRRYIRTQKKHHARISFQDELVRLLKKHRIAFDEKYLLG
jgi:REP element-mobilizing transposase RayT